VRAHPLDSKALSGVPGRQVKVARPAKPETVRLPQCRWSSEGVCRSGGERPRRKRRSGRMDGSLRGARRQARQTGGGCVSGC
jgi:hypothetical protein